MRRWLAVSVVVGVVGVALLTACALPLSSGAATPLAASPSPVRPSPTPTLVPGVPADVPLAPGAYSVQVMRPNALVVYRVDKPLEEVMAFYTKVLQRYGWQQPAPEDAVVGSAATMMRFKLNGDQLVLSLRYKPDEDVTIVAISVKRGGGR